MHTRTGWRYEVETKTIREVPSNQWVASMDSWDAAQDHAANARLIAAAPRMLAALEKAREEIEAHFDDDELGELHCGMDVAIQQIRAAITEAKGA